MKFFYLGELVRHDRRRLGLNQEDFSKRLQSGNNTPIDPHTKKPKLFSRTWVAKLEAGFLTRELSNELRMFLADITGGDKVFYELLPVKKPQAVTLQEIGEHNVLPLIKYLANLSTERLTFTQLVSLCKAHKSCASLGINFRPSLEEDFSSNFTQL